MGCFKFLKITMFCFNGIIFLGGAAILGVGIWVKVDGGSFIDILSKAAPQLKQIVNVGYLCIAIGSFLVVIGFLGCCGAVKENKCMLMIFFIIILLIFVAQVVGAVIILAFSSLANIFIGYIQVWAVNSIKNDYGKISDITTIWDSAMKEFKCCGFKSYDDFTNSSSHHLTSKYPKECCTTPHACPLSGVNKSKPGCSLTLSIFLKRNTKILGIVALGIAILEVMYYIGLS
ncbi:tetraspanin-1-like [Cetorhinus maximus]